MVNKTGKTTEAKYDLYLSKHMYYFRKILIIKAQKLHI